MHISKKITLVCGLLSLISLIRFGFSETGLPVDSIVTSRIKGVTLVAPPKPIDSLPFVKLKSIGTEWIALVPYAFTPAGEPNVYFSDNKQWWGERIDGIETCIRYAKAQGIKVMLKPQIWVGHSWIGDLTFKTSSDWKKWEEAYKKYIFTFINIAVKHDVEMICIGTEINQSVDQRPEFWQGLIKEIKDVYKGKLTYSANWDHYFKVPFWNELDFIGISSYFPLSAAITPEITTLTKAWKPICANLKKYSATCKKPILFTEYGYLAVDGCAGKTWEIESKRRSLPMNDKAQANAYEALWQSLNQQQYWAGGFVWKWFPDGLGHEGDSHLDYSPQDKPAEKVLEKWFKI